MFTRIIYINLDRRPDRNENVINELSKIDYKGPVVRFKAVDAKELNFKSLAKNLFTDESIKTALDDNKGLYTLMTKGGIGCALSHGYIYANILAGSDEYVLILEDDIWFDDNFDKILKDTLKNINYDYDVLWLGYHTKINKKLLNNVDVPLKLWGLFGYIINKKAAKKFLEVFPLTLQIDSELPRAFIDLKVYALKENDRIVLSEPSQVADTFGTDIQYREPFKNDNENDNYNNNNNNNNILILIFLLIIFIYYKKKSN
jgi:GR25 family glycosyltransferase involved in LPS biosynthesis